MFPTSLLVLAVAVIAGLAHPMQDVSHHALGPQLPDTWYHSDDHFAHTLFRRGDNAGSPAAVGSTEWATSFPTSVSNVDKVPQSWTDALSAAVAAGLIPSIPPSTLSSTGFPTYAAGFDPMGKVVCSATYKCRNPGDMWDAPDGVFAVTFDDGPLPTSDPLYSFLSEQKVHATHFMIGVNVLQNQAQFNTAFHTLQDDIAVHTWTHPYMTTLTNEQVLGELGYTILIIYQLTGGRLPKYWRPPFGDSDNRVRAIAKEVFGMETVIWNHDTEDWSIASGKTTLAQVEAGLQQWFAGPKSPGLMILEHELSNKTVQAFIDTFPVAKANGWTPLPISQLTADGSAYRNAADNEGDVTSAPFLLVAAGTSTASSPSNTATSTSSGVSSGSKTGTRVAAATPNASGSPAASTTPTTGAQTNSAIPICSGLSTAFLTVTVILLPLISML